MLDPSDLEKAVLQEMSRRTTNESAILCEQIESAKVIDRKNTGAGFYVRVLPDHKCPRLNQKIFSNVFAHVFGLSSPMAFVLFTRDGWIDVLEGAAVDDNTANVDFTTVAFEML